VYPGLYLTEKYVPEDVSNILLRIYRTIGTVPCFLRLFFPCQACFGNHLGIPTSLQSLASTWLYLKDFAGDIYPPFRLWQVSQPVCGLSLETIAEMEWIDYGSELNVLLTAIYRLDGLFTVTAGGRLQSFKIWKVKWPWTMTYERGRRMWPSKVRYWLLIFRSCFFSCCVRGRIRIGTLASSRINPLTVQVFSCCWETTAFEPYLRNFVYWLFFVDIQVFLYNDRRSNL
jgi:hypothetical protein